MQPLWNKLGNVSSLLVYMLSLDRSLLNINCGNITLKAIHYIQEINVETMLRSIIKKSWHLTDKLLQSNPVLYELNCNALVR